MRGLFRRGSARVYTTTRRQTGRQRFDANDRAARCTWGQSCKDVRRRRNEKSFPLRAQSFRKPLTGATQLDRRARRAWMVGPRPSPCSTVEAPARPCARRLWPVIGWRPRTCTHSTGSAGAKYTDDPTLTALSRFRTRRNSAFIDRLEKIFVCPHLHPRSACWRGLGLTSMVQGDVCEWAEALRAAVLLGSCRSSCCVRPNCSIDV
jgi:hypothetical protein